MSLGPNIVARVRAFLRPIQGVAALAMFVPAIVVSCVAYYALLVALVFTPTNGGPAPMGAFTLTRLVWRPEPWELVGYVAGYVIIPLLAALLVASLRSCLRRGWLTPKFFSHWPLAVGLLLASAVAFKLGLHQFAFSAWREMEPRGEAKQQLLVLAALGVGVVAYARRFDLVQVWRRVEAADLWRWRWWFFAALVLVMFDPNFKYDHYHYSYFLGIINDLRHGKWLLVDTAGYYGMSSILLLHFVFWITGVFSYTAFNLVLQLIAVASVVSWVYLLRRLTKSAALAYVAGFAMVVYQYLPVLPLDHVYQAPSTGTLRHVPFLLAAWAWVRWQESGRRSALAIALALAAVGFWWFPDSGLYLAVAIVATVAFALGKPGQTILAAVGLLLGILFLGLVYAAATWFAIGEWPDFAQYFAPLVTFSRGYQLFPLPWLGFYQIYFLVFLSTLWAVTYHRWIVQRPLAGDAVAFFIASYGALQLSYYVSRSYSLNLASRHTFLLVLVGAWWYAQYLRSSRTIDAILVRGASPLAVTLVVFGVALTPFKLKATLAQRNYGDFPASFTAETIGRKEVFGGDAAVLTDIATLKRDYADESRPALLHWWDVKILMEWDKANALPLYEFSAPLTTGELDAAIAYVRTAKPRRLFVGRTDTAGFLQGFSIYQDKIDYFWKAAQDGYVPERQLETLTVYRLP